MKKEQDYIQDVAEIRSMMERSSKFLNLSGLSGIMAGIYALAGAYIAYSYYHFNPNEISYQITKSSLPNIFFLAVIILILALATAVIFSYKSAQDKGEKLWNPTSRRLLISMAVPLITGGILILIFISKGLIGLIAPMTLIFYGMAMYNASKYTIDVLKFLGLVQLGLGLISSYFIEYGLLIWAAGFGVVHIIYGTYMYFWYER